MMGIPDAVRRAALFPERDLHALPAGHPTRVVQVAGVVVRLLAGLPVALISPERLEESAIPSTVDEVRRFLRAEERDKGVWIVSEEASPRDLAARLQALGMRPSDLPGVEAHSAAMVAISAPPPAPDGVVARRAASFEEFLAAQLIMADAFGMDEETRRAFEKRAQLLWSFQSAEGAGATFVALLDGEVVAFGGAYFGRTAVFLGGGGTRPDRRGRGAYRALVRARWDAAVERGTPALTVGAGAMSRPILERLGFTIVGWDDCLLDDLAAAKGC
ncbi:MAG TPA: GNAT family N-acetyltransferase [Gaiellaceae bacterium]|nr:GNAT family N-acetyltransferase [Gaiellaceae bacterium]